VAGTGHPDGVVETHVSRLVFLGDRVYKIKKSVRFAFLDFSTVEIRAEACLREVQLNRRLSPDVYLGVLDVVDAGGTTIEHVVEMRRMAPERRLATLVTDDAPGVEDHVRAVARRIAAFHATATRGAAIDADASHDAVSRAWWANLTEMAPFADGPDPVFDPGVLAEVELLAVRWLEGRSAVFADRIAGGHVVDGHGDLLAEDIFCLDDGPRILDCIEFDDHLRHVDVWNDVAFLVMDLERLGRPDLGAVLCETYREHSADSGSLGLVEVFVAYRALVRAKVAGLRCRQTAPGPERDACRAEAGERLAQCLDHLRRARIRLVLVGGLPGTGKSTLASELADRLGASVLSSDPLRKELAGAPQSGSTAAAYRAGAYTDEMTDATYRALLARARVVLERGGSVILDASWVKASHRAAARALAAEVGAEPSELCCTCPTDVAAARIATRLAGGDHESDADAAVAAAMAVDRDPWADAREIDTSGDRDDAVRAALDAVQGVAAPP
jgi:uncharacterized protein